MRLLLGVLVLAVFATTLLLNSCGSSQAGGGSSITAPVKSLKV